MEVSTINVQITKNPRQYEAVRLGMEATVNRNETAEEAIKEATRRLNELYEEMYTQKTKDGAEGKKPQASPVPETKTTPEPAPVSFQSIAAAAAPAPAPAPAPELAQAQEGEQDERELLTFNDKRLQKIIVRIEKAKDDKARNEVLKNVAKYYKLDEGAAKAIALAAQINQ